MSDSGNGKESVAERQSISYLLSDAPLKRKRAPKSSTGCITCRSRKKKCDERHPICLECDRIKMKCVWSQTEMYVEGIGKVPILRGKIEYKVENDQIVYQS